MLYRVLFFLECITPFYHLPDVPSAYKFVRPVPRESNAPTTQANTQKKSRQKQRNPEEQKHVNRYIPGTILERTTPFLEKNGKKCNSCLTQKVMIRFVILVNLLTFCCQDSMTSFTGFFGVTSMKNMFLNHSNLLSTVENTRYSAKVSTVTQKKTPVRHKANLSLHGG